MQQLFNSKSSFIFNPEAIKIFKNNFKKIVDKRKANV